MEGIAKEARSSPSYAFLDLAMSSAVACIAGDACSMHYDGSSLVYVKRCLA
jgi:hypothetical protein